MQPFFDMHETFMNRAIKMARFAAESGEVPVGAVLVAEDGTLLAESCNQTIGLCDPCAHAEILAIRHAAAKLGNYRLLNTTLYATVEPCAMCMGAAVHARVKQVVFGVYDPKWGAAGSLFDFSKKGLFNHHIDVVSGICEDACKKLMVDFFREKRNQGPLAE